MAANRFIRSTTAARGWRLKRYPGPNERLRALRDLPDGPDSVAALLAASEDPSPDIVRIALRRLGHSGDAAIEPLRARMLDVDPGLVADFARTLSVLGDEEAARQAAEVLSNGPPPRRIAAAMALEELAGEEQMPPLLAALRDPLAAVRLRTLRTVTRIGAAVDAPACAALLHDKDLMVRAAAVEAVVILEPPPRQELAKLAEMVTDDAPEVRQALAHHLGLLDRRGAELLLADSHRTVRAAAVATAPAVFVPQLEAILRGDTVVDVRITAARRLAEIGLGAEADALIAALADPALMVRAAAERAMREAIGRDRTVDHLLDALADADPTMRRRIVYTLGHLDAVEARSELAALARDPDREVRLAVVHCGAQLFGAVWPPLADLKVDPDPAVAYAATLAAEQELRLDS